VTHGRVMAGKVMAMRAIAAVTAFVAGEAMNVGQVCEEVGISRQSFYKYVARCRVEGLAGFEPRSRRPLTCPQAVAAEVEDAVIGWRKQLADGGLDHGATTIQWHLGRDERFTAKVPAVATVHRILVRRGFVTPQPEKRPKSSWRRFEAPAPNEWWQIDSTDWVIAAAPGLIKIFNIVDDHSRVACASRAVEEATGEQAWSVFGSAAQQWGLPAGVLSDNGLCFSGKLRGFEVLFEAKLRDAGVRPITGRPYHPQTTGKVERFQQTLKRWLRRQDRRHGLARDLAELQIRLDTFQRYYNEERPHQGIGRITPLRRWLASPPVSAGEPLPHPGPRPQPHPVKVNATGIVRINELKIGVGVRWAGCDVTVILDQRHATIFSGGQLIRHLQIDRTRTYQPTGRRRGGPRQPRHLPS
jgi:transposase InsO family protein/transposase-like protein